MQVQIKKLLDLWDRDELVLPEIQRDFVWNRGDVLALFDSLYRGFPIGNMLIWKTNIAVGVRSSEGSIPKRGQTITTFYGYLLDGQQRLTAIRLVRDDYDNYPLMFSLRPDAEDGKDKPDENRFFWKTLRKSKDPWYVLVSDVINPQTTTIQLVESLKKKVQDIHDKDVDKIYKDIDKLKNILEKYIGIIEYENNDYRKATELFVRFNSTGKRLKKSDLIATELVLTVQDSISDSISDSINLTRTKYRSFPFTSTFLIQCLAAIHTGKMNFKKPQEVWAGSKAAEIKKSWEKTEKGLAKTIEFLTGTVHWDSISWLPSINSIMPLIYILAVNKFNPKARKDARKWLLSANLHAIFSGSVYSELDRILRGLKKHTDIDQLVKLTKKDIGEINEDHFNTRRKSCGAMSLYISMLRNKNAKDWCTGTPLNGRVMGHNAELQVHHFFPRALLLKQGYISEQINTFANYTIINKNTNLDISDEEPAVYIGRLGINKQALQVQCIPDDKSLWNVIRYEDFLEARKKLLAKKTNSFLNKNL